MRMTLYHYLMGRTRKIEAGVSKDARRSIPATIRRAMGRTEGVLYGVLLKCREEETGSESRKVSAALCGRGGPAEGGDAGRK